MCAHSRARARTRARAYTHTLTYSRPHAHACARLVRFVLQVYDTDVLDSPDPNVEDDFLGCAIISLDAETLNNGPQWYRLAEDPTDGVAPVGVTGGAWSGRVGGEGGRAGEGVGGWGGGLVGRATGCRTELNMKIRPTHTFLNTNLLSSPPSCARRPEICVSFRGNSLVTTAQVIDWLQTLDGIGPEEMVGRAVVNHSRRSETVVRALDKQRPPPGLVPHAIAPRHRPNVR